MEIIIEERRICLISKLLLNDNSVNCKNKLFLSTQFAAKFTFVPAPFDNL